MALPWPDFRPVRAERYWEGARSTSRRALAEGALVPLATRVIQQPGLAPFVLRELQSRPPRHLGAEGPKPNPFLPWDRPLEVERIGSDHVLLLNKYPVQDSHLLVITSSWQPQSGWLTPGDWQAVATVAADTGGLWFFNSSATAGASQPHRHLQLLPRTADESSCPLASRFEAILQGQADPLPWRHRLSRRSDPLHGRDLRELYEEHCRSLGLGERSHDTAPRQAYNLLFDDHWFLTVLRSREHCAGYSVNGLGFAGYLLATAASQPDWLGEHGPWSLLAEVAVEAD